jgi:hypothetical protein
MNLLKLIVAILVIAAVPVSAQAQKPVTEADVKKVVEMIRGDKAKTQTYCDMAKLGDQIEEANEKKDTKKADELTQKMDELGKKLGPEFAALRDGLQEIDMESQEGREIGLMLAALDSLCAK